MHQSDSVIVNLVSQIKSIAQRNYLQPESTLEALRQPALEDFLTKINLGVALYNTPGHFFYVSQSLSRILGYSTEIVYAKGPELLQQITTTHDRPLVERLMLRCETALKNITQTLLYPRISFDYHILSGKGILKRIYQHILPNAIAHDKTYYTLFILHDFTGFKTSPILNYRLSYLNNDEKFITLNSGQVIPSCPYPFTTSEKDLLKKLAEGKSMEAIAIEKHNSLDTLKKHRNNILRKTGAKNMVALIVEGLQNCWLDIGKIETRINKNA